MKNNIKWIAGAAAFVILIGGAAVLYNTLSKNYKNEDVIQEAQSESQSDTETKSEANPKGDTETNSDTDPKAEENATSDTDSGSKESTKAPDFTVLNNDGNEVKLSDYFGKPIVLNFWATWCYYCKEEMPEFNEAYAEYSDVQFFMLNATDGSRETVETAKAYIEEQGFDFQVFYDTNNEASYAYYVTGLPATYFIDKDGNLVARGNGMLDKEALERGIQMIME